MTLSEGRDITVSSAALATGPAEAARVGARTFAAGGNAMDAAAAAALACAVLEPQAVDLGGYVSCATVLDGRTGLWAVDANSVAPAAAREDMFRCLAPRSTPPGINELEYACSVEDDANVYGPLSAGVPGFLAGVGTLWERWGRLPWAHIVEPAAALVEDAVYGEAVEAIRFKQAAIARFPSTAALLLPGGTVPRPSDPWLRPELAATLRRIAAEGWRDFYAGELGRRIADFVLASGGILTRDDMAAYQPRVSEPCIASYRNAQAATAPLPNGGLTVLQILNLLERSHPVPDGDPLHWKRLAEALELAWADRLRLLGDPAFSSVPGAELPGGTPRRASPHGTVHISAADREGNLVSLTISQGGLFGSCFAVPGAGVILGHGMCRFDPHPGHPNSPASRKRPLNNVCPMILRLPDRDVAIGARGGRRIVSAVAHMVQRIVDFGATVFEAAAAPRLHAMPGCAVEVSDFIGPEMLARLNAAGLTVELKNEIAGPAHGAEILHGAGVIRAGGNTWAAGI